MTAPIKKYGDLRAGDRVRQFKSKLRKTVTGPVGRILWFRAVDVEGSLTWRALVAFRIKPNKRVDREVDVELLRKESVAIPVCSKCGCLPCQPSCDLRNASDDNTMRWETCDCGGELRFDPDMVGDTCGGLTRIGWNVCVKCGKGWLASQGKSCEKWKLSGGGRSVETGIGRIRVDGAVDAEKLMARIAKLPELELEVAQLRKRLGGWDGEHETGTGIWYHFKAETVQAYETEIAELKAKIASQPSPNEAVGTRVEAATSPWKEAQLVVNGIDLRDGDRILKINQPETKDNGVFVIKLERP